MCVLRCMRRVVVVAACHGIGDFLSLKNMLILICLLA